MRCTTCQSRQTEVVSMEVDGSTLIKRHHCRKCQSMWSDNDSAKVSINIQNCKSGRVYVLSINRKGSLNSYNFNEDEFDKLQFAVEQIKMLREARNDEKD